jgi:DNA primase
VWGVNQGCLGFHVWPNRLPDLEVADELRVDLDPSPGIVFEQLQEAAVLVRQLLAELGIEVYIKTSGSRGLHLYVALEPRWDSYEVRAAAVALARQLERRHPDQITAAWWKEERGSRVFVDFNQNAPHKTVFGAWCVRPRVGAQVSTPIAWDDLAGIVPDELTIATVPARLAERGDPWAGMYDRPQDLTPLLERSAQDRADGLMDAPWPPVYPKMPHEPPRVAPSRARTT